MVVGMKAHIKTSIVCLFLLMGALVTTGQANDNTAWKKEFDRICAQTEIATALTAEQLHKLISDSDKLLAQLKTLEDPWAKIYIMRIKKCRDFFEYTIEWQENSLQDDTS